VKQAARPASEVPAGMPTAVQFVPRDPVRFRLEHLISTMIGGLAVFDFDDDEGQCCIRETKTM
jgi:hypothetical protein